MIYSSHIVHNYDIDKKNEEHYVVPEWEENKEWESDKERRRKEKKEEKNLCFN